MTTNADYVRHVVLVEMTTEPALRTACREQQQDGYELVRVVYHHQHSVAVFHRVSPNDGPPA